jgi:hypothetical protein
VPFTGDPAEAAAFGSAGAGLVIVSAPAAHPGVLEPLASALAELS